ncbi:MAG: hypothetical protein ACM3S4_06685 [Burkholderiales bacterium]
MYEIIDTIMRYFGNDGTLQCIGAREAAQEIINALSQGERHLGEAPDLAILFNDKCIAIEHFEFDCYRNSRRGSEYRIEDARIDRGLQALPSSPEGVFFHDEIKGVSSYEQYIKNVSEIFNYHYLKIPNYKRNLINNGVIKMTTPVKIVFLIEDVSPLGTLMYDGNNSIPVLLARSREFIELMRTCPNVDYVIACSSVDSEKFIWLICKENLDDYERNSLDYAHMDFIEMTPQVTGFNIEIPRD